MKHSIPLLALSFVLALTPVAHASEQNQAKEVARNNNCPVKKIEVYKNSMGATNRTIYQVQCNLPKATDQSGPSPDALLIACETGVCELMRPIVMEKK